MSDREIVGFPGFNYGAWWGRVVSDDDDEFNIDVVVQPNGETGHLIDPADGYPCWLEAVAPRNPEHAIRRGDET